MLVKIILAILIIVSPTTVMFVGKFSSSAKINPPKADLFSASIVNQLPISGDSFYVSSRDIQSLPERDWNTPDINLSAKAALAIKLDEGEKVLYAKNTDEAMPIASLTKLLTALIVSENLSADERVKVSSEAVATHGSMGDLVVGEELTAGNLMKILLVPSSNDAATAFGEHFSNQGVNLIDLMNKRAGELAMSDSFFDDLAGLSGKSVSSADDLKKLALAVLGRDKLSFVTVAQSGVVSSFDGKFSHLFNNSNKLLNKYGSTVLSKTGYNGEAGECLLMVVPSPDGQRILYVILGSSDRFGEMDRLISWAEKAFIW